MRNVMRKIGRGIVAFLPVPACFLLQLAVIFAAEIAMILPMELKAISGGMSFDEVTEMAMTLIMDNLMLIQIVSQAAMLAVFGLWYYLAYGRKRRPESAERPDGRHIALLVFLGLVLQFGISSILSLVESFAPQLLETYNELMELMELGEMSAPAMIAVAVMAPLSEEVLCRGIIFRLAERVGAGFWIANIIQALSFGILHGNWVQGIYAFALGLVLGYVYAKYRNIWLCMLLHGAMNLSSYIVGPFYSLFPEERLTLIFAAVLPISAVLFVLCFKPFVKKKSI